jgi:hypothetical protein
MHLNHKLKQEITIHLNKVLSFSRSPIIASKMLEHSKVMLNELQYFLKLLCSKAKMLKSSVG